MMAPLRLYHLASRQVKWQFWMTVVAVSFVFVATISGQMLEKPEGKESWFTFQNLTTAAILVYGVGMNAQNFRDLGRRVEKLEHTLEKSVPETYVRQDVFEERMGRRATDPVLRK